MKTFPLLTLPLVMAFPAMAADNSCSKATDSNPSSLGATGWAEGATGGCGAPAERVYTVTNRQQLLDALYDGKPAITADGAWVEPSHQKKIIYVKGSIDLNADENGNAIKPEHYMAMCSNKFNSYDVFFDQYLKTYLPHEWNKQSLVNGRPPELSGELESLRQCFSKKQSQHIVLRVGSNTSIIGLGADAEIKHGQLRLGQLRFDREANKEKPYNFKAENIVIRNIHFTDAFDDFPGWGPRDSFKVDKKEFGQGNCSDVYVDDKTNPTGCKIRGGRWNSEYDNITVENASQVWIDHNSFSDGDRTDDKFPPVWQAPYNEKTQKVQHHDALLDVVGASTKVTISHNQFKHHDKVGLIGGSDSANKLTGYGPSALDVTMHDNFYDTTGQRMPRVRFGRVHVYNNVYNVDYRKSPYPKYRLGDAMMVGTAGKIFAENNVFNVPGKEKDIINKMIGFSSKQSNKNKCIKQGWSEAQCGSYYYAQNMVLNGKAVNLIDVATKKAEKSKSNAKLEILDPNSNASYWIPNKTYSYLLKPTDNLEKQVIDNSGAGKLTQ
ncbi:pectate lyase [Vibrio xiamenensis]|uniref:Pectate lyase n=1 Tax=Vibrio xiamenensis TaxID=861298 RepID=A0A1G7XGC0_9VIBR|nr:polysaccharide lyase family 1 protein [Vibrio xiamenensis]SDG83141.1 pectate lyase [Vibrio xiamenensis]